MPRPVLRLLLAAAQRGRATAIPAFRSSPKQGRAWETLWHAATGLFPLTIGKTNERGAILERLVHMPEAIRVFEALPSIVMRHSDAHLFLAHLYRQQGNDIAALHLMMRSQVDHIRDGRVHLKIAELFRDDGDRERAYIYTKTAALLRPEHGAVRRLTFEVDHELFEEGAQTLDNVLKLGDADILRYLPMINRISPFYPSRTPALKKARERASQALWAASSTTSRRLARNIEQAISCRWMEDAKNLSVSGFKKGHTLKPATANWLRRVDNDLGRLAGLLEMAWNNEQEEKLIGLKQGTPREVDDTDLSPDKTVEMFIPPAFFCKPSEEKLTYASVRQVFSSIGDYLLDRTDLMVVPRLQLNWRHVYPRLSARAVSYHTRTVNADQRHLHVQESPLHGYCSFDNLGFSGFSSIAANHSKIAAQVSALRLAELEKNHRDMLENFVGPNISKYPQSAENQELPERYVFVAMQIPTDVVSRLAWLDGIALLRGVVDFYSGSDTKVVVKRHPYCGSMTVQRTLDELAARGQIIITKNSVHNAISEAQAVFTVNSGVGFESLMHLKPVLVSGACDYSYAVRTVQSLQELRQVLDQGVELDSRRALEFLYYYYQFYTVPSADAALIARRLDDWLAISTCG